MNQESKHLLRKKIFSQTWPVVLQSIVQSTMFIADTAMLGRVGKVAIGAIGIAGPIIWTCVLVLSAVSVGTLAIVSRATGEKDEVKKERESAAGLLLTFLIGFISAILCVIFLPKLALLYEVPNQPLVVENAISYIWVVSLAMPFLLLAITSSNILWSAGDVRTPLIAGVFCNIFNIFGNYVLIFGKLGFPELGVLGAGISTAISEFLYSLLLLFFLFLSPKSPIRLRLSSFRLIKMDSIRKLIRLSLPPAIEPIIIQTGFLAYYKVITSLGEESLAAHRAAISLESISFIPCAGFAVACGALVGQFLGAKKVMEADMSFKESIRLATWFMLAISIVLISVPGFLIWIFIPAEPRVIQLGALCLIIAAVEQPFMGWTMVFTGMLRGAGDTISPVFVSAFGVWIIRLPLAYIFAFPVGLGLSGVWVSTVFDWAIRTLILWLIYKRGRWKKIKL